MKSLYSVTLVKYFTEHEYCKDIYPKSKYSDTFVKKVGVPQELMKSEKHGLVPLLDVKTVFVIFTVVFTTHPVDLGSTIFITFIYLSLISCMRLSVRE